MRASEMDIVDAARGVRPLDVAIRGARIVNVFDDSVRMGDVGVVGDRIVAVGDLSDLSAVTNFCGEGRYLLPGFVDSHMHLESSMLLPAHFARIALTCGTTTCLADPHEIANVMGIAGVRALVEAPSGLSLHVLVCAPSTIPSAPGLEGSGYSVDASQIDRLAHELPQTMALGEVMTSMALPPAMLAYSGLSMREFATAGLSTGMQAFSLDESCRHSGQPALPATTLPPPPRSFVRSWRLALPCRYRTAC